MKRRILSLVAVLTVSAICISGCGKSEEKSNDTQQEDVFTTKNNKEEQSKVEDFIKYNELEDGTISIRLFDIDAPMKNVEIPEEIDGKK